MDPTNPNGVSILDEQSKSLMEMEFQNGGTIIREDLKEDWSFPQNKKVELKKYILTFSTKKDESADVFVTFKNGFLFKEDLYDIIHSVGISVVKDLLKDTVLVKLDEDHITFFDKEGYKVFSQPIDTNRKYQHLFLNVGDFDNVATRGDLLHHAAKVWETATNDNCVNHYLYAELGGLYSLPYFFDKEDPKEVIDKVTVVDMSSSSFYINEYTVYPKGLTEFLLRAPSSNREYDMEIKFMFNEDRIDAKTAYNYSKPYTQLIDYLDKEIYHFFLIRPFRIDLTYKYKKFENVIPIFDVLEDKTTVSIKTMLSTVEDKDILTEENVKIIDQTKFKFFFKGNKMYLSINDDGFDEKSESQKFHVGSYCTISVDRLLHRLGTILNV